MAEECPEVCKGKLKDLKEDYQGHKKTLYGDDGMKGLVGCVQRSVKRSQLAVTVLAVLSIVAVFIVYSMGAFAENKEKVAINSGSIKTVKQEITHIKEDQAEIKGDVKEVKGTVDAALVKQRVMATDIKEIKKAQTSKKEFYELMLKAVKEGKK